MTKVTKPDYSDAVDGFSLATLEAGLSGDLGRGINACVECCDRHTGKSRLALRCIGADGAVSETGFDALQAEVERMAVVLRAAGVGKGDVVAGLLPRRRELVLVILATWRLGAIYQPLFTAFGPKAIEQRLETSRARLVVTNSANRSKLVGITPTPKVALFRDGDAVLPSGDLDLAPALAEATGTVDPVMLTGDDLFMLLSTSGTTGLPKGVPVPLRALLSFAAYMRLAIGLTDDDVFWNIADPGWAYGLYYAITGPLLLGHATTLYEGGFTVESTWQIVERFGVTSLAGSPSAFRLLMAAGPDAAQGARKSLRAISSAGEPLNPEVVRWVEEHLGAPIMDHYGQTETGMTVNNHHALKAPFRPGSAGFAMPGYRVAVIDETGAELPPDTPGLLAVDIARSPLMWFKGYYNKDTPAIAGGYYRTGDTVEMAADGSVSFIGRSDDIITSSGYRIGPFDVESALIEHPAVAETAVVGVPDPERTEIVKAFVVLKPGHEGNDALAETLRQHVRSRLSAHAYPRALEFVADLPKTPSGKIQRFLLRQAEVERQRRA